MGVQSFTFPGKKEHAVSNSDNFVGIRRKTRIIQVGFIDAIGLLG
jgi:hypothetical protein